MRGGQTAYQWLGRTSDNVLLATSLVPKYGQRTVLMHQPFALV
ncbi:hypothetical protein PS412_05400 [Limosilactobacillus fermentum]